jgi:hypothetical protein
MSYWRPASSGGGWRDPPALAGCRCIAQARLINRKPPLRLQAWEGPFLDPHARLPQHPDVARERTQAIARAQARA